MYVSIGQTAEIIGVAVSTLRRWDKAGSFMPDFRTKGGHRRYKIKRITKEFTNTPENRSQTRITIAYSRVSSADQKLDLVRQTKRLSEYCKKNNWNYEVISDLGSGINYKKKGLTKLIDLICSNKVSRIVLTNKDRLLRFGSPLLFKLCKFFDVEVIILEEQDHKTFEQQLVADVIEIMTVFTAKMHGRRSHQNKKAVAG